MWEEEKQKSTDIEEYEYGDTDLEFEEEDEDADEYDAIYMELEEQKFDFGDKEEDFEQVEELKPPCVSSWIDPKTGKTEHAVDVVARKDDAQIDFEDAANLCIAAHRNNQGTITITKRAQEPDVCSICYEVWTSHGSHRIRSLPCGHVFGASCIEKWFQTDSCDGVCPQCNKECELKDAYPLYVTRVCNFAADQKPSIRRFTFSGAGYIAFKKYEFSRRSYVWNKRSDALKREADALGRQNDAMKRRSELLDRMANVLKRVKALEHRDNVLRRANALRLRADALGRRADEYLQSAETFGLRAKALHQRPIAFGMQVNAFRPRLDFFVDNDKKFHGVA